VKRSIIVVIPLLLISGFFLQPSLRADDAPASTNQPGAAATAVEPQPVPVGKGSYASSPPNPDKHVLEMLNKTLYIDSSQAGKPIPTNHWWSYLINKPTSQSHGKLWPYPLTVQLDAAGTTVFYPTEWNNRGNDMETGPGISITGDAFTPQDACALNWSDWSLAIRYRQDGDHLIDVTLARGMPYAWFEFKGVQPRIGLDAGATLEDAKGQPLQLPATTNRLIVSQGNRLFAIFAPDGSTFSGDATHLAVAGAQGSVPFLVVAALPSLDQMDLLTSCAYAIPRKTIFDSTYDPVKGEVDTTWKIETTALQGTNKDVLQGWLPHHYRTTRQDLKFTPAEYATVRGRLRCTVGQEFAIAWPFNGIPPMLPAPAEIAGQAHPFQTDRMKAYIDGYVQAHTTKSGKDRYGKDTYWGGKDLTQYGLYADMSTELGFEDDAKVLSDTLRDALTDWFTYTPGETAQYFARYDRWKGMVGFKGSYGSEEFVDNHFHYGYFTMATALLGMHDPQFLQDYGPMAKLVAKQYANWDRNDPDFPYFRTFDVWAGRSYASASSSPNGGNQESSSEAMQSWSGLFLLGIMLQDKDMTAAGAMGWSIEESATEEYWFDYYGWKDGPKSANFPPTFQHAISGNAYDGGYNYGTFFGGQPHFIYGIQWLPLQPGLYYLGRDPKFSQHELDSMFAEEQTKNPGFNMSGLGADWGDSTLGFVQFFDPEAAVTQLDTMWDANDPIARSMNTAGITYYFSHADRQLGPVAWAYHADLSSSLVYQKPGEKNLMVVAWNESEAPVVCHVYRGDQVVGQITVPSRKLSALAVPLTAP
jgi:endoglucanase Acf2